MYGPVLPMGILKWILCSTRPPCWVCIHRLHSATCGMQAVCNDGYCTTASLNSCSVQCQGIVHDVLTVSDSGEGFLWGHITRKSTISSKKIMFFCLAADVYLRVHDVSFVLALLRQILTVNPAAYCFIFHISWVDSSLLLTSIIDFPFASTLVLCLKFIINNCQ